MSIVLLSTVALCALVVLLIITDQRITVLEDKIAELGDARLLQAQRILELQANLEDMVDVVDRLGEKVNP